MARSAVRSERLHQAVARRIGAEILSGSLVPGAALEGEIESCVKYGVSRTAYREAIRILVAKGLLESRPKAGTHVTSRSRWNLLDPDILDWMFAQEPDPKFVRDLFELRGVIEPAAAEMAATRCTPEQIASMDKAVAEMGRAGLASEAGQRADRQFHRLLLEATHNEAFVSLAGSVEAAVQWTTRFKQRVRKQPRDPLPEHRALFVAISKRDPVQARIAMVELLRLALVDMEV